MDNDSQKYSNNLAHEKSPYLLQHANNPVNWQAWGKEAFAGAVADDKPVLLSIGYSTCHWCHVMADESFSDPAVAEIMNRAFICIKLDREERPDLDQIYITAVSALNGSAGWPLNVFLTPDGRPFFGGTYFPPDSRPGMPSWTDVLLHVERAWNNPDTKKKIMSSAEAMTDVLKQHLSAKSGPQNSTGSAGDRALIENAVKALTVAFDKTNGGFSRAPKFPMPPTLLFLLEAARLGRSRVIDPELGRLALDMAIQTLNAMADGGIFDHIGGGFHRYATDDHWHLPHFEKMLYDNALLAAVYLEAGNLVGDNRPAEMAMEVLTYMTRDLMHADGGFYSAEDADSYPLEQGVGRKREGAFYGWRTEALRALLSSENYEIVKYYYGLRPDGNVDHDPLNEFSEINVLYRAHSVAETSVRFDLSEDQVKRILSRSRNIIFTERARRPRPHLDDKILTAWNGLALTALSKGFMYLKNRAFLDAARKTAVFIRNNLYDSGVRPLLKRRWRDGSSGVDGLAEDYIFLIQGLLDLYQADLDATHLSWALPLAESFYDRFYDQITGTCFTVADDHDPHLLFRPTDDHDNVLPSVTSTAAIVFSRLAALTGKEKYHRAAQSLMAHARSDLQQHPTGALLMVAALGRNLTGYNRIVVFGEPHDPAARDLIRTARSAGTGSVDILLIDNPATIDILEPYIPDILSYVPPDSQPVAYACSGHICHPPVSSSAELQQVLSL